MITGLTACNHTIFILYLWYENSMIDGGVMSIAKVAISIEASQLKKIDFYVKKHVFKSRSQAFQVAVVETLKRLEHSRLAKECEKLDIHAEQEMADLGLEEDLTSWPKY